MARALLFSNIGFQGAVREIRASDPDLVLNGRDFEFSSALVASGTLTLYAEAGYQGASIQLDAAGGPESDGAYEDHADWSGQTPFHVRSVQA
ncbi:MAG: beta/gamma crystallin-related protein [Pseudoxanthomonas sp.]|nr:beta/gamma crystallin-related protein [Pseudoxanthomonas sp.]